MSLSPEVIEKVFWHILNVPPEVFPVKGDWVCLWRDNLPSTDNAAMYLARVALSRFAYQFLKEKVSNENLLNFIHNRQWVVETQHPQLYCIHLDNLYYTNIDVVRKWSSIYVYAEFYV